MSRAMQSTAGTDPQRWIFWSTRESIDSEVPSATAIAETLIAVPLYWWIAIKWETYLLLLISAAVAPLVLLRSDRSVALGVRWFTEWLMLASREKFLWAVFVKYSWTARSLSLLLAVSLSYLLTGSLSGAEGWELFWRCLAVAWAPSVFITLALGAVRALEPAIAAGFYGVIGGAATVAIAGGFVGLVSSAVGFVLAFIPIFFGFGLSMLFVSIAIRIGATLRHAHQGVLNLPRNYRRLTLCTSPLQEPELVPGLPPGKTDYTFADMRQEFEKSLKTRTGIDNIYTFVVLPFLMLMLFLPAWIYRLTLKSTAWFWWPLAFLGGDLRRAIDPARFQERILGTLLAKASFVLAGLIIFGFIVSHFVFDDTRQSNPFLSVLGFVFLIDWKSIGVWQILAFASAIFSVTILFWADIVRRDYARAVKSNNSELLAQTKISFGWIERTMRVRFLVIVVFWLIVATHAVLLLNSYRCWFEIPNNAERWARWIYDEKLPSSACVKKGL